MTMLPTTDQYATKTDLAELATKADMTELKQDMRELRADMSQFVRTFIVAQATAMVGLTGIFIGVTKLL